MQTHTPSRPRPPRKAAGFTLLELLVVLALAALAITVAGIGGQAFVERARYQQTVRDISSQLRQARLRSVDSDEPVLVRWLPRQRQLQAGDATLRIPDALDVRWQALDATQGNADAAPVIFLFDPDGGARGGRFAVLRAGRGVSFQVNWLLGRVQQSTVEVAG
ncbi:MAG: prepilin-type N-terminal cleavage/methylation domain-containing protein [Ottowia sp.]|nr:prepilin-type N-terminal cleavage/methylation domain-containing protein [Ottowia sp.]